MADEIAVQRSLLEKIFDEMFEGIEGQEEFDVQTIQKLKQLAASDDLKKAAEVIKAIKQGSVE